MPGIVLTVQHGGPGIAKVKGDPSETRLLAVPAIGADHPPPQDQGDQDDRLFPDRQERSILQFPARQ